MATLSPKFLVFDSKTGPESEDRGLIYCSSKDANVQWPKSVRRGRPRKGRFCPFSYFYYNQKHGATNNLTRLTLAPPMTTTILSNSEVMYGNGTAVNPAAIALPGAPNGLLDSAPLWLNWGS
jgi:hypothetical protein